MVEYWRIWFHVSFLFSAIVQPSKLELVLMKSVYDSVIPIKGCDSFVFCAILEFTLAQFLMRRQASKPTSEKIEEISKTSIKKYQVKPFESEVNDENELKSAKAQPKLNIFMKIIGLDTYMDPIQGLFPYLPTICAKLFFQRLTGSTKLQNDFFQSHFWSSILYSGHM